MEAVIAMSPTDLSHNHLDGQAIIASASAVGCQPVAAYVSVPFLLRFEDGGSGRLSSFVVFDVCPAGVDLLATVRQKVKKFGGSDSSLDCFTIVSPIGLYRSQYGALRIAFFPLSIICVRNTSCTR